MAVGLLRSTRLLLRDSRVRYAVYLSLAPLEMLFLWLESHDKAPSYLFAWGTVWITILVGYILGRKDYPQYFDFSPLQLNRKLILVLLSTLLVVFLNRVFLIIGMSLVSNYDPQGLSQIKLTGFNFLNNVFNLPLVAISEELLQTLTLLTIIKVLPTKSPINYVAALLVTLTIFGFIHTFNWPVVTFVPIMFSAIPGLIILLVIRNVYPLMFAHYIYDLSVLINLWPFANDHPSMNFLIGFVFIIATAVFYGVIFSVLGLFTRPFLHKISSFFAIRDSKLRQRT